MVELPTDREIENAAKKTPSARSIPEQHIVDSAIRAGNQTARNLDHAARETERVHGR